MKQITIDFDASPFKGFTSCREYVQSSLYRQPMQHKAIAADMDYSPSQLSRKLTQSPADSARFTLDDLENYIAVTGDVTPVYYLLEKHVGKRSREELLKLRAEIDAQLETQAA